jgi:hypothetical protein
MNPVKRQAYHFLLLFVLFTDPRFRSQSLLALAGHGDEGLGDLYRRQKRVR